MADDELILGHRNSEWTGMGPILEEDIAFSSMAQDKLGQAYNLYKILNSLGEKEPDELAFNRLEKDFKCCHFVEYPIGEYDYSIIRHFLFDTSEYIRFEMLSASSNSNLANIAKKFRGEIRYHKMHADTWILQLGNSNEVSNKRLQDTLNHSFSQALGIFEHSEYEDEIISSGIFAGEEELKNRWMNSITEIINKAGLKLPDPVKTIPETGGRKGKHTEFLKPLLEEMSEVFSIDPEAEW
jgi:ring-1,2-phenylacetyl-CoA epoxidase subunit PaaC